MWRMIGGDEKCKRDLWVKLIELCDKLYIGDKREEVIRMTPSSWLNN